jgi:hypothetical protein
MPATATSNPGAVAADLRGVMSNASLTGRVRYPTSKCSATTFYENSGIVIDVMNRLAEAADIAFWQGGYKPHVYQQRPSRYDLDLILVNEMSLRAASFTHMPSNKSPHGSAH